MALNKKISPAVIRRLPRYFRYLTDLLIINVTRISSSKLSEKMEITASQIRQDLNCFGGFGQQGYGYNVKFLRKQIANILGVHSHFKFVIIGAGNLGQALANYSNFQKIGFKFAGIFDKNLDLVGTTINNKKVMHIDTIGDFLAYNKIDIAMICIPANQATIVTENLVTLGIKAFWNFSPTDLKLSNNIIVENVHLVDSLMVLGYKLLHKSIPVL